MRVLVWVSLLSFGVVAGCADEPLEVPTESVQEAESSEERTPTAYTDWTLEQSGTTAKPAYAKGCRYLASEESLWELPSDGENDRLTLVGSASGEVSLTLYTNVANAPVMMASVTLQRVLTGKAYYEAVGSLQFGEGLEEMWTVLDGTLCFESTLVDASADVPGEFSLIAQKDGEETLRTLGGTFVLSPGAASGAELNIDDSAIALDLR